MAKIQHDGFSVFPDKARTCGICEGFVSEDTGKYFHGVLIHHKCVEVAERVLAMYPKCDARDYKP